MGTIAANLRKLDTAAMVAVAHALYADEMHAISDICATVAVSRAALYHYLGNGATPTIPATDQRGTRFAVVDVCTDHRVNRGPVITGPRGLGRLLMRRDH
jgi:hypothetical protein